MSAGGEPVRNAARARIEVRTADGIYTFHHAPGVMVMFHHLFGPDTDSAEAAWQQWLTGLLA